LWRAHRIFSHNFRFIDECRRRRQSPTRFAPLKSMRDFQLDDKSDDTRRALHARVDSQFDPGHRLGGELFLAKD
jgi:hypothetical protein